MRTSVLTLLGLTALGLVSLVLGPIPTFATAVLLAVVGVARRRSAETRDAQLLAGATIATGVALAACAVLLLVLAERDQDAPVKLGPDTGFDVSTTTRP